jgi:hypothetical protein
LNKNIETTSYNGYIAQGIDSNKVSHTIPIAFQNVTGGHTGKGIKEQYDKITRKFILDEKSLKNSSR